MKSKKYNVRVFNPITFDIIREFDTLKEARTYAKRESKHNFCVISQVLEEYGE